ncbi:MAG: ribokinase [Candidatus Accumulibacter sp.]|jgi:ribokinase|nr:ribokinase [Accumulibacter sp.]
MNRGLIMTAEILVFGSMNVDLVFAVETLPRPGETVLGPGYMAVPGGKGANQAVAAARAGVRARMIGCLGDDGFGEMLLKSLMEAGVNTSSVRRTSKPTGCAAIGVDARGANQIMVAAGANSEISADDVDDGLLGPEAILTLQMEVPAEQNWKLARRAHERGARIILNVAPATAVPPDILAITDFLVVNEHEALAVATGMGMAADNPIAAARGITGKTHQASVVTLGADGAFACDDDQAWRVAALLIRPVDTTAAGDCFVGWLAARLSCGDDLPQALRWASAAAGQACLAHGAQPSLPALDTVTAALESIAPASRSQNRDGMARQDFVP